MSAPATPTLTGFSSLFPTRASKTGITVDMVRSGVLDGIPAYTKYAGQIPADLIQLAINTAEDMVERETDVYFSIRKVYCVQDQLFEPPEVSGVVMPPLDKPANWFAGQRSGAITLPKLKAKKVYSLKLLPFGQYVVPIVIPQTRIRLQRQLLQLTTGAYQGGTDAAAYGGLGFGAGFYAVDGMRIPAGLEIIYDAGLTKRELENDFSGLFSLVLMSAAITVLVLTQARIGGGTQKEALGQDSLTNTVEYAQRNVGGPLGGEIKQLAMSYQHILSVFNSYKLNYIYL